MTHPDLSVRVHEIRDETEDVRLFDLRHANGESLPPFTAGAHIDIALGGDLVRQYSLLNSPDEMHRYLIAVARETASRGGSAYLHERVSTGDLLAVSLPRTHFALDETAPYSVLIAGGIGITPLWSMAQRLTAIGEGWEIHYAARTRAGAALLAAIEPVAAASGHLATYFNLDGDPLMDIAAIVAAAPGGSHFYCCGPAALLDAYRLACASLAPGQVHFEQFTAAGPVASEGGFTLELAKSRKTVEVAPGQTILDALKVAGFRAAYSCREGVCGACETVVLAGVPDHRDVVLTEDERAAGKTMMICCSGALSSRLVLDL
jgi:ferredoxin-NADP reductase